jgi:hypothetical protein
MPSPSSRPRGHGVRRGMQSAITSVINTTLICPKAKFDLTGSNQIAAPATMSAANHHRRTQAGPGAARDVLHTSSRVSTIIVDASSSANVVSVIATLAAGRPNQAAIQPRLAAHPIDVDIDAVQRVPDEPPSGVAQCRHSQQLKQPPRGIPPKSRLHHGYRPLQLPTSGDCHLLMLVNSLSVLVHYAVSRRVAGAKWA